MKIASQINLLVYIVVISLAPIRAMEDPIAEAAYQLVTTIQPKDINDAVTFVKRLSDRYLVIINRKGQGQLLDIKNNYKCIYPVSFDTGFLYNVFMYTDKNNQQLLVAVHHDLYVCNPAISKNKVCIKFDHKFSLHLAEKESKRVLAVVNLDDKSTFQLELCWESLTQQYCHEYKNLSQECLDKSLQINEGVLVDSHTYKHLDYYKKPGYLPESFKMDKYIYCYHKTLDGMLYVGHDNGVVTVWEPKNNNQKPYNETVTVLEPKNNNLEPCFAPIRAMENPVPTEPRYAPYKLVHIIKPK